MPDPRVLEILNRMHRNTDEMEKPMVHPRRDDEESLMRRLKKKKGPWKGYRAQ